MYNTTYYSIYKLQFTIIQQKNVFNHAKHDGQSYQTKQFVEKDFQMDSCLIRAYSNQIIIKDHLFLLPRKRYHTR